MATETKDILLRLKLGGDDEIKKRNSELLVSIQKNKDAIEANSKALKEYKQAGDTTSEAVNNLKVKNIELANSNKALNSELQNNIKVITSEVGALTEKRAILSNMNAAYSKLSADQKTNTAEGIKAGQAIRTLTDELKAEEKALGDTRRNVGNYTDSIIEAANAIAPTQKSVGELRKELIALRNTSLTGKTTEEIQAINQKIGDVTDQLSDLKNMQKSLGQELGANIAGSLQVVSASVEGVAASLALFGVGEENIAAVQKNIVALIAVTQALGVVEEALAKRTIQNTALRLKTAAANALDTASKWAATVATVASTEAEAARAVVMGRAGIVTKAAAAIQWLWNAALAANPIGLVIAGIAALVAGIGLLIVAMSDSTDATEAQTAAYNKLSAAHSIELELDRLSLDVMKARGLEGSKLLKAELEAKQRRQDAINQELDSLSLLTKKTDEQIKQFEDLGKEYIANGDAIIVMKAQMETAITDEQTKGEEKRKADRDKFNTEHKKQIEEQQKELADYETRAQDSVIALMKEGEQKELAALQLKQNRELEAIKGNSKQANDLRTALNAQYESERTAITAKYTDEEIQRSIDANTRETQLRIDIAKEGTRAEVEAKIEGLRNQLAIDLADITKSETEKQLLRERFRQDSQAIETAFATQANNQVLEETKQRYLNEIEVARQAGEDTFAMRVEQKQREINELQLLDGESVEQFKARKLQLEADITTIQKEQTDERNKIKETEYAVAAAVLDGIGALADIAGQEGEKGAGFAKMLTLFQIGLDTAKAISSLTAASEANPANAVTFGGAGTLQFVSGLARIFSNIAQAKKLLSAKEPKQGKAQGGLIVGPGSGTSDSVPINASANESVLTAASTGMFAPLLSGLNLAGGGVPIQSVNRSQEVMGEQFMARAVSQALAAQPPQYIAIDEYRRADARYVTITENAVR